MESTALQTPLRFEHLALGDEAGIVKQYFECFNQGEFQRLITLFTPDGCLYPPFEEPVVGKDAILSYLLEAAEGMQAEPLTVETQALDQGRFQIEVKGKVTALVFKVNVMWHFVVTSEHQIESVTVKLMASLQELLKIRPSSAFADD